MTDLSPVFADSERITPTDPYARAIAYATAEGRKAGENAAGWYMQDTIGGRVTRGADDNARAILAGIEDGDPAVLDTFPTADLSGEWADTLTGPRLLRDACIVADACDCSDPEHAQPHLDDAFSDICDAYETAFSDAAQDAIADACRAILAD